MKILPSRVRLGKNFVVECSIKRPKKPTAPMRYEFHIKPIVPNGKKYRTYACLSFPGVVHVNFIEVK